MKTRKSTLELTPLLDVVLILLFVFMLMLATQVNESAKVREDAEQAAETAEQQLEDADDEISALEETVGKLLDENETLKQDNSDVAESMSQQTDIYDAQQESAQNLAKAVAQFIKSNEEDIEYLLDENEAVSKDKLMQMMSEENVTEELLKYEAISRQFYFIDLELKTSDNRLYINNESTPIGIAKEDTESELLKEDKIDDIKALIEDSIEQRQGGAQMVFITLKVHDRYVYKYGWELVWEAMGEIQEKYGTDKIFRTHITIIKN